MNIKGIKAFFAAHIEFIGVLVGSLLIAVSMGTYTNWDAQLEFEAATSIVTRGFPYVTTGLMINQPPLGFYSAALVLVTFGESYLSGVGLSTAFGFGCVVLVYGLGTMIYGKKTGLFASALFGLVPWHVYMSRIFLIDNQYLFLGLLFLFVGVLAVRRNSEKLVLVAGLVFALAFLTKLYAVFMLVPLLLMIVLFRRQIVFKLSLRSVLLFVLPSIVLQVLWFGVFANQNFFGVYFSSDFTHPELVADPVAAFLPIVLVKSAGWFLFAAVFFSLALGLVYWKKLKGVLSWDLVCLGSVLAILGLDMFLVFGFHLMVPYVSAVKYSYSALPFFCLIAASLVDKSVKLVGSGDYKKKTHLVRPILAGVGLVLLFASLVESVHFVNGWTGFVAFGVDSVTYYGFNLFSDAMARGLLDQVHCLALVLVVGSVVLALVAAGLKKVFMKPKGLE